MTIASRLDTLSTSPPATLVILLVPPSKNTDKVSFPAVPEIANVSVIMHRHQQRLRLGLRSVKLIVSSTSLTIECINRSSPSAADKGVIASPTVDRIPTCATIQRVVAARCLSMTLSKVLPVPLMLPVPVS